MAKQQKTTCKPLVVVTVLGGVAEVILEHGARGIILDYDNLDGATAKEVKWERDRALERFPYGPIKKKLLDELNEFLNDAEDREKEAEEAKKTKVTKTVTVYGDGGFEFNLTIIPEHFTPDREDPEIMDTNGSIYGFEPGLRGELLKNLGKKTVVNVVHKSRILLITKILDPLDQAL